jgi:hypothetical protein
LADEQQTEDSEKGRSAQRAEEKAEAWDKAHDTMKELEEKDDPPTDLKEWPDDEAKYVTYGGGEGDHGYDEGPEKKLGPSSLERHEDGSVTIEGEEVDNPDDYKSDPVEAAVGTPTPDDEDGSGKDDEDDRSDDDADDDDEKDD